MQRPQRRCRGFLARAEIAQAVGVIGRTRRRRHGASARRIIAAAHVYTQYQCTDDRFECDRVSVLAAVAELERVRARANDGCSV